MKLFSSGKAAFRFLVPREVAEADPFTAPLVQDKNALVLWFGPTKRIIMYPCNDNSLLNFVCIHPDAESHASSHEDGERAAPRDPHDEAGLRTDPEAGWNKKQGEVDQLLKVYEDFQPAVKALLSKADPAELKVWQLLDMDKLPTWTAGKLVLLGDAAHPFTPRTSSTCCVF